MIYTVTYQTTKGTWEIFGNFEAERKARKEAGWLSTKSFVAEVRVYRGGVGAERVA